MILLTKATRDHTDIVTKSNVNLDYVIPSREISDLNYSVTKTFADQISLVRLPTPEPGMFYGDPLKYPSY